MRLHTAEELNDMSIKQVVAYFKDLHEENRTEVLNL